MKEVTPLGQRKSDHIRINIEEDVQSGLTSGLEFYHFIHHAVPEVDFDEVDISLDLFGRHLDGPILISSMTGGTEKAGQINQILATAAQETRIAMGLGSMRIALEEPTLRRTFQVRNVAPDILLFANLGAVQLNYGYGASECQRAIDIIEADALYLHFNALQEAVQKEGNTNFAGLAKKVETICKSVTVPVIAKEVGWGFCPADIVMLAEAGVAGIDVAGAGGTSWSQVEMHRAESEYQRQLAGAFANWGNPTAEVIQTVAQVAPSLKIIASGGLRSGVEIAKCLALGACMGGMAGPFLKTAAESVDATINLINLIRQEVRICLFATGSKSIGQLRQNKIKKT
jgi:isopentenyl-diphosphate Delta-isomerase